jgi:hypothetical protein
MVGSRRSERVSLEGVVARLESEARDWVSLRVGAKGQRIHD